MNFETYDHFQFELVLPLNVRLWIGDCEQSKTVCILIVESNCSLVTVYSSAQCFHCAIAAGGSLLIVRHLIMLNNNNNNFQMNENKETETENVKWAGGQAGRQAACKSATLHTNIFS